MCKVRVQICLQVEQDVYETTRPVHDLYRDVTEDAVRQVRRLLGPVATIVGDPVACAVITPDEEMPERKGATAS